MVFIALRARSVIPFLSALLAMLGPGSSLATGAGSSTDENQGRSSTDGDFSSTQTWSIVPAGSVTASAPGGTRRWPSSVASGRWG